MLGKTQWGAKGKKEVLRIHSVGENEESIAVLFGQADGMGRRMNL